MQRKFSLDSENTFKVPWRHANIIFSSGMVKFGQSPVYKAELKWKDMKSRKISVHKQLNWTNVSICVVCEYKNTILNFSLHIYSVDNMAFEWKDMISPSAYVCDGKYTL